MLTVIDLRDILDRLIKTHALSTTRSTIHPELPAMSIEPDMITTYISFDRLNEVLRGLAAICLFIESPDGQCLLECLPPSMQEIAKNNDTDELFNTLIPLLLLPVTALEAAMDKMMRVKMHLGMDDVTKTPIVAYKYV